MGAGSPQSAAQRARRRQARRRSIRKRRLVGLAVLVVLIAVVPAVVLAAGDGTKQQATPEVEPVVAASPIPAAPAPAAATSPTDREAAPSDSEVSIAAVGDITMGATPTLPPNGGAGFFDAVARQLRGDVVIGNLETALTNAASSQCGGNGGSCFDFRVPPAFARRLDQAGFTLLNLANNHAYDYFAAGQRDTVRALRRNGLRTTGRPGEIAVVEVGAVRVAVLGFAPYEWAQSLNDIPAARRLVRKATRAADLVIVTMHAGAEGSDHQHVRPGNEVFLGEDRGNTIGFAHAVIDAGADLVVGHGPHVLRGMEWYRHRLIAYSLGNFSGWHTFALSGVTAVSGILHVTLHADGSWVKGDLFPTRLVEPGTPEPDPGEAAHGVVRELSRADFGPRAVRISRTGTLRAPT